MAEEKKTTTTKKAAAPKAAKTAAPKEVKADPEKKVAKVKKVENKPTRLLTFYRENVVKALLEKFKYKSVMAVPKLEKIVVNVGVGDATSNSKLLDTTMNEIAAITGQAPVPTVAKKSIASFKLRQGQKIGCKVTLRGKRMYEFFDKLISISLPRVRDFRGVSKKAFDGKGNYTLGIKEQLIFPEIIFDKVVKVRGMDIVICTTANTDAEAYALLEAFGFPFMK